MSENSDRGSRASPRPTEARARDERCAIVRRHSEASGSRLESMSSRPKELDTVIEGLKARATELYAPAAVRLAPRKTRAAGITQGTLARAR